MILISIHFSDKKKELALNGQNNKIVDTYGQARGILKQFKLRLT